MRTLKYNFFSLLIVLVMMFLIKNILMVDNGIDVVIFMKHNKDMEIQTYYTDDVEKNASEDDSVKIFSVGSTEDEFKKIRLNLKTKSIKKLRIDFDTFPGEFSIQKIEINGKMKVTVTPDDISKVFFSQIEIKEKTDKYIVLDGKGSDPFMVLIEENGLNESSRGLDILQAFSFFILLYFIVYKLMLYLKIKKLKAEWNSVIYIFLIYLIFIFPILKIDNKEVDDIENRILAKKPKLIKRGQLNLTFGKDVEEWLNDHFYKRRKILKAQNDLDNIINKSNENESAILGKEGWIFYKEDSSIENFQNINLYSEEEVDKIIDIFLKRKEWMDKQGIKYYIFVAPDKNVVYSEFFPEYIKKINKESRVEQLEKKSIEKNINFIYPYRELEEQKKYGLLYWKNDTHWNDYGSFIGTEVLIKKIKNDFPELELLEESKYKKDLKQLVIDGDLSRLLGINAEKYKETEYYQFIKKTNYSFSIVKIDDIDINILPDKTLNFYTFLGDKLYIKTISSKPLKVLVLRDSFGIPMVQYLSETFGTVEYIHTGNLNELQEKIIKDKPDIIIHEVVGRYLDRLGNDIPKLREVN